MPYVLKGRVHTKRARRGLLGFGDFNDETPCASIPAGDPYRKPGNYCATPDGGYVTFNPDGSTYVQPSSSSSGPTAGSVIGAIGGALVNIFGPKPPISMSPPIMPPTGMSTTTKVALAGGALLMVALIARRR